ncbi:hypothetical protein BASA81_001118 [Batrachochytrium salamandrivorans]|nr:hypothetical protein BASA81_001118 [Batrachochytrium salamandrivorans]
MIAWLWVVLTWQAMALMTPSGRQPSVVMIISDDLRADRVYAENSSLPFPYRMPNVRRMMNSGITFENAMANFASCGPSRQSFLTGRTPDALGVWNQLDFFRQKGSAPRSLPEQLVSEGFKTVSVGKVFHWDANYGVDEANSWSETYYGSPNDVDEKCPDGSYMCTCTEAECADYKIAKKAVELLPELAQMHFDGNPFFLAVGFRRPHLDWRVPPSFVTSNPPKMSFPVPSGSLSFPSGVPQLAYFAAETLSSRGELIKAGIKLAPGVVVDPVLQLKMRNAYWLAAAYMDKQLGTVLDAIDTNFLTQETILIFLSDHGFSLGERTFWGKQTLRDEALKVPLVLSIPWMPNLVGKRSKDLVELIDLYPTMVSLLGLQPTGDNCLLGKDLSAILESDVPDLIRLKEFSVASYPRCSDPQVVNASTYASSCTTLGEDTIRYMGYSIRNIQYRYTQWRRWMSDSQQADWSNAGLVAAELYDHGGDTLASDPAAFENVNLVDNPTYLITATVLRRSLELTAKATPYSDRRCGRKEDILPAPVNAICTTAKNQKSCQALFASRCMWITSYGCQASTFCGFTNKSPVTESGKSNPVGTPGCLSFESRCTWTPKTIKAPARCTTKVVTYLD